jgi:CRISPR type IV-associated protein Csf3
MRPLRIRAYLQTAVISDRWLPLDGILFYLAMRERFGPQFVSAPNRILAEKIVPLPLQAVGEGEKWFYACSFARWSEDMREFQENYTKKFDLRYSDLIDFGRKRGFVNIGGGRYKAYHFKIYARIATYVEWYCVGVKEQIEKLLRFATHLGKKTSQGWGSVLRWEIEPIEKDWSIWREGKLMRAIPDEKGKFLYGIRPPYWYGKHQFMCQMPEIENGRVFAIL